MGRFKGSALAIFMDVFSGVLSGSAFAVRALRLLVRVRDSSIREMLLVHTTHPEKPTSVTSSWPSSLIFSCRSTSSNPG